MSATATPRGASTEDLAKRFLEIMLRIRFFDEVQYMLFTEGAVPIYHTCYGREAVAAAVSVNLGQDDYIATTHRGPPHLIVRGVDLAKMLCEMLGKANGLGKGKGGIDHMMDLSLGVLGEYPIVGASLPIAVGAALATKLRRTESVVVSFFGDGATGASVFHESVNMASSLGLPVLFVCENDGWDDPATNLRIPEKAAPYGIPGDVIGGDDPQALLGVVGRFIQEVRSARRPALLEVKIPIARPPVRIPQRSGMAVAASRPSMSYREMTGVGDGRDYLENYVAKQRVFEQKEVSALMERLRREVESAASFAEASPEPEAAEATTGVFS